MHSKYLIQNANLIKVLPSECLWYIYALLNDKLQLKAILYLELFIQKSISSGTCDWRFWLIRLSVILVTYA